MAELGSCDRDCIWSTKPYYSLAPFRKSLWIPEKHYSQKEGEPIMFSNSQFEAPLGFLPFNIYIKE